jgi:hypothetical protein
MNTYLTIRFVLKYYKLPERVSEEETEAVVKAAIKRAKARGE